MDLVAAEVDTDGKMPTGALELYMAASKAILSQLAWFDIIGAVSCGRQLILGIDYSPLLESRVLDMRITGCQNDVVASIVDIVSLRNWKAAAEERKALNIMELGARGRHILESLEASMLSMQATEALSDAELVSLAFARAAIVYLHTVISGPNPYLEDIRTQTIQLKQLLRELAQRGVADRAVWPACVVGCFSQEDDTIIDSLAFPFAISLTSNVSVESHVVFRSKEYFAAALERGRKCSELRVRGENSDWTLAGHDVPNILLA